MYEETVLGRSVGRSVARSSLLLSRHLRRRTDKLAVAGFVLPRIRDGSTIKSNEYPNQI